MEFVAQYVEMQFQLEHNNVMMGITLTVMDATQIVQLETTTTVQPQLLTKTQSLLCVLRHVQLDIIQIRHSSHA